MRRGYQVGFHFCNKFCDEIDINASAGEHMVERLLLGDFSDFLKKIKILDANTRN